MLRSLHAACLLLLLLPLTASPAAALGEDEVPGLIAQLVHGSPGESSRALDRLRYLGVGATAPALRMLLVSPDGRDRIAGTSAFVVIHDPGATSQLEQLLATDSDWEVRRNAVNALAGLHSPRVSAIIARTLRHDPQERVRKSCVSALAKLGGGGEALARTSGSDSSLEVRLLALDALAHTLDSSVARRLRPLLQDSSALIRFASARTLAWVGDPAGRRFLESALASKDSEDVRHAATAISDVPKSWAVDLLVHTLDGPDGDVAFNSAVALTRRQDERGTGFLRKMAASGGPDGAKAQSWLDRLGVVDTSPKLGGGAVP